MQSSYNVIKKNAALTSGDFNIEIKSINEIKIVHEENHKNSKFINEEVEAIEKIASGIIGESQARARAILEEANIKSAQLLYEAKEKGFNEGYNEGHDIGYSEGYEKGHDKGYQEALTKGEEIIRQATETLTSCKIKYDEFLKEKEVHIREVIFNAVKTILKREVKHKDSLNDLVFSILSEEKDTKAYIIRCNSTNIEGIRENIDYFKQSLAFMGDIFIIEDNLLEEGSVVVEKDYGKVKFTLDNSLEKLKEALMEG